MAEKESEQGDDDEVNAAGEVRQLVHLEHGVDQKEDQLQTPHHDGANGEVIVVQYIYGHCVAALGFHLSPSQTGFHPIRSLCGRVGNRSWSLST